MRQFKSFADKVAVPAFTRNDTWQTVSLSGLIDPDAKLVTIEIYINQALPNFNYMGVAPVGDTRAFYRWFLNASTPIYTNVTMAVSGAAQNILLRSNRTAAEMEFHVTAEWGGDGIVVLPQPYANAPGLGNDTYNKVYRDVDMTPYIPVEHRGNVKAVMCLAVNGPNSNPDGADVRGRGSVWTATTAVPSQLLQVIGSIEDATEIMEVRETGHYSGKISPVWSQQSFVYFQALILKGAWDDGTGDFYEYQRVLDPVDDDVGSAAWQEFSPTGVAGTDARGLYWKLQAATGSPLMYAREVGSTNPALQARGGSLSQLLEFPLDLDGSLDVEQYLPAGAVAKSYIQGWLDFCGVQPGQATGPDPADTATGVPIGKDLGWMAGAGAATHNVYFGTNPTPGAGEFQGNQAGTSFALGVLAPNTTYYWRIDGVNAQGKFTTTGVVWRFTTSSVCDWFDPDAGEDWEAAGAGGQDWASSASGADWKEDKEGPDWKDDKGGPDWFDPKECS